MEQAQPVIESGTLSEAMWKLLSMLDSFALGESRRWTLNLSSVDAKSPMRSPTWSNIDVSAFVTNGGRRAANAAAVS
jgi:hypothetical protein